MRTTCINYSDEPALNELFKVNGVQVVTATHPDRPNYSGNARGRKCHMVDDIGKFKAKETAKRKFTRCGMLVDEHMRVGDMAHTVFSGRWCQQCFGGESRLADAMVGGIKREA